jgi:hypothetical protein
MLTVDRVGDRASWGNVIRNVPPLSLAARIAALEQELRDLRRQQRLEDQAAFLLAILRVRADWFLVAELVAEAVYSPELAAHLAGFSTRQIGKKLRAIEIEQRAAYVKTQLRLLRHETNGAALWKVDSE